MAQQHQIIISLDHVSVSFGRHQVISDIDIDIRKGEVLSITGPSGIGKTTLLRLIAGMEKPTGGAIHFTNKKEINFGFVFQNLYVFPWQTVEENVLFGLSGEPAASAREKTEAILKKVGLWSFRKYYPNTISGGMAQRVAVARAIVRRPEVLLLDEPFSDLDTMNRQGLYLLLKDLSASFGTTIILVTHDINEAVTVSDRIITLSNSPCNVSRVFDDCANSDRVQLSSSILQHISLHSFEQYGATAN